MNIKWWIILFVVIFVILTIFSSDLDGMNDGLTRIGFPLVFMQDTGGKCTDCSALKWFKWDYLIIDIAFAFGVSFGLISISRYFRRSKQHPL